MKTVNYTAFIMEAPSPINMLVTYYLKKKVDFKGRTWKIFLKLQVDSLDEHVWHIPVPVTLRLDSLYRRPVLP